MDFGAGCDLLKFATRGWLGEAITGIGRSHRFGIFDM
jgi:hypothetical protein